MEWFWRVLIVAVVVLMLLPAIFPHPVDPSNRPVRAGDVVVSKLGRRAVIGEKSYPFASSWRVRLEDGSVEHWTDAEIRYRESE